jgi:predicted ATPase/DNA-binding winged helix-turn-helix (wHTH) protein
MMPATDIVFGPFCFLVKERLLLESGKPVHLGGRAIEILSILLDRPGVIIPKQELISRVWPNTTVREANLTVHIAALRRILAAHGTTDRYIVNVPGRGYMFAAGLETGTARPGLPAAATRLIGRAGTLDALAALISQNRFVTIVGEGGVGKTAVALAFGRSAATRFKQRVHFLDLTTVRDAGQLLEALASTFEIEVGQEDAIGYISSKLSDSRLLLVLDNCEHLVNVTAATAQAILRSCPGVHILATSCEPLRVEGEHIYRLRALDVPPLSSYLSAQEALAYSAPQLFIECVASRLGEFNLADRDAPFVATLCHRVEGLPLGIELAAGQVGALDVRSLAACLEKSMDLLMSGCRGDIPRHQSLKSSFDWSYSLLSEDEKRALLRLSVFDGPFALHAASAALCDLYRWESECFDLVAALVIKSLVVAVEATEPCFRLLNTTRAYARKKLIESKECIPFKCPDQRSPCIVSDPTRERGYASA